MPSHPDRVRKFNCPEHNWKQIYGVHKVDSFFFALDPFICLNCDTIISKNEKDEVDKKKCLTT